MDVKFHLPLRVSQSPWDYTFIKPGATEQTLELGLGWSLYRERPAEESSLPNAATTLQTSSKANSFLSHYQDCKESNARHKWAPVPWQPVRSPGTSWSATINWLGPEGLETIRENQTSLLACHPFPVPGPTCRPSGSRKSHTAGEP